MRYLVISLCLITILSACQAGYKYKEPRYRLTLEENCKNEEYIRIKDTAGIDEEISMRIGMPIMENYACKYNSVQTEGYFDDEKKWRQRTAQSIDGVTYSIEDLKARSEDNLNVSLVRVTKRAVTKTGNKTNIDITVEDVK